MEGIQIKNSVKKWARLLSGRTQKKTYVGQQECEEVLNNTSLGGIQGKTTARYNFRLVRTALLKRQQQQKVSVGEDVERGPLRLSVGNGNWYKQFGKYMAFPLTTKNRSKDVAHGQGTWVAYVTSRISYLAFFFFFFLFLKKVLRIVLLYDPTISLLGIYPKDLDCLSNRHPHSLIRHSHAHGSYMLEIHQQLD